MPPINFEDYNVYNMDEAHKYVSEVIDPAIKQLLYLNLGSLLVAVFPPSNRNAGTTKGFDALLFVQLNYDLFRYKEETIKVLQGDLTALDGAW